MSRQISQSRRCRAAGTWPRRRLRRRRAAGRAPDPLEPVGLLEAPAEQRQRRQRDQHQPEQAAPAQRGAGHPPHDRDEAGSATPGGRHQGDGLGPVAASGLLSRDHPADRVRACQQRPTEGEQGHEPPVAGAERGQGGDRQPERRAAQHDPPPADPIGQGGQGQAAQRGQPDDPEPDAEDREGQPDLCGNRRAGRRRLPERPGHVGEGGGRAELGEAGGCGKRPGGKDRRVTPTVEPQSPAGARGRATRRGGVRGAGGPQWSNHLEHVLGTGTGDVDLSDRLVAGDATGSAARRIQRINPSNHPLRWRGLRRTRW